MPVIGVLERAEGHPEGLPDLRYAWLEAPLAACLTTTEEAADWSDPERWPEGRIFGEAGEYRWRWAGGALHAVLLLEDGPLPKGFGHRLELEGEGEVEHLLFGEWVDPEEDPAANPDGGPRFYTPEIPRVQHYPVALGDPPHAGKTASLRVRRYRDAAGEAGGFLRCAGFEVREEAGDGA